MGTLAPPLNTSKAQAQVAPRSGEGGGNARRAKAAGGGFPPSNNHASKYLPFSPQGRSFLERDR